MSKFQRRLATCATAAECDRPGRSNNRTPNAQSKFLDRRTSGRCCDRDGRAPISSFFLLAEGVQLTLGAQVEVRADQGWRRKNAFAKIGLIKDFGLVTACLNHSQPPGQ